VAGKHAPLDLAKYLDIHGKAMRELERKGCVAPDGGKDLTIDLAAGGYLMSGRIHCVRGVKIDVTKLLAVRSYQDDRPVVQTTSYTYHTSIDGIGNVFRYCDPHATPSHPDHKPFHHKHTFDALGDGAEGEVSEVDEEERPTLAEVIEEACEWYYDHADAIEARRRR